MSIDAKPDPAAVSVGRLTTAWYAWRVVVRSGPISAEVCRSIVRRDTDRTREVVSDGVDIALLIRLLDERADGHLHPSAFGLALGSGCDEDLPNAAIYAALLLRYISAVRPPWAIAAVRGGDVLLAYARQDVVDCFCAAGLVDRDVSDVAREWWIAFERLVLSWNFDDNELTGYLAEQATFEYEKVRLSRAGLGRLASQVMWVSQQSDSFGFDIFSFVGAEHMATGRTPADRLRIEVKGTARAASSSVRFYLTRNEWETACSHDEAYLFYLWHRVGLRGHAPEGPSVLTPEALSPLVPQDRSDGVAWTQSRVAIQWLGG